MEVIHFGEAESYEPEEGWRRVSLCRAPNISVEYFVKPPGHASPLHEHREEQVTLIIEGEMIVRTPEGEEVLGEGDAAFFAAHEPHAIENRLEEPSIGIDIFHPGRSFDFWPTRK